jgi:hypothetical protein
VDSSSLDRLADPGLFLPFFVIMWVGITAVLSVVGGWGELGRRFPATTRPDGETFSFVSGALNAGMLPVGYGNCLFVTVGSAGVRLSVLFLFRILHPPLLIPWTAIEAVTRERHWFTWRTVVRIRDFDRRLALYGRAGEEVAAVHARMKITVQGGALAVQV